MNLPGRERWDLLWPEAQGKPAVGAWHERLVLSYSESHRHYHTGEHIAECLREFDSGRALAVQPRCVELAIWFHDAVYDPHRSDNEERSAEQSERCGEELGLDPGVRKTVRALVLATKLHDASVDRDAPLIVDVDLSILGQPPERFWRFEAQVREEYQWVPHAVFAARRAEILESFLGRQSLYHTEWFRAKYDRQARTNLAAAIARLRK